MIKEFNYLSKKELTKFIKRFDEVLSLLDSTDSLTPEDEAYFTNAYFALVRFKQFLSEEKK